VAPVAAALTTLCVCSGAGAQTVVEPPIVNPGARSLGLGGAFVAMADDATAAWANPGGLTQLVRPEISAELRTWSEDRLGIASNVSGLGFASFVLPRRHYSLAIYGQTLASLDFPVTWQLVGDELALVSELVIVNAGLSGAVRVSDSLSIGLGATVFGGAFSGSVLAIGSSDLLEKDELDSEPGATAGLLWRPGTAWAVGASYRSGADFVFGRSHRASVPDITAGGARWRSSSGRATVTAEIEYLAGLEDRVRLHAGGEWVFLSMKPLIGLRTGLWYDPRGGKAVVEAGGADPESGGVTHASVGAGFAFERFQLDVGFDVSDRTTIAAVSAIFTF